MKRFIVYSHRSQKVKEVFCKDSHTAPDKAFKAKRGYFWTSAPYENDSRLGKYGFYSEKWRPHALTIIDEDFNTWHVRLEECG